VDPVVFSFFLFFFLEAGKWFLVGVGSRCSGGIVIISNSKNGSPNCRSGQSLSRIRAYCSTYAHLVHRLRLTSLVSTCSVASSHCITKVSVSCYILSLPLVIVEDDMVLSLQGYLTMLYVGWLALTGKVGSDAVLLLRWTVGPGANKTSRAAQVGICHPQ
jgi:hypothetical protein